MKRGMMVLSCLLSAGFLFLSAPVKIGTSAENFSYQETDTLEKLRKVPAEEIAKWSEYDSGKYGIVTSVKNQSPTSLCWSYAALAAIETSLLREGIGTKDALDLDEEEAAKAACGKFLDPLSLADGNDSSPSKTSWDKGGYVDFISRLGTHWQGVMPSGSVQKTPQRQYSDFVLENAVKCNNDVAEIKSLVAQYGGVAFEYQEGYTDYHVARGPVGHVSEIVGWNDGIAKENFKDVNGNVLVNGDGAWLVKNSWGVERNNAGYLWLSYESEIQNVTAFDFAQREDDKLLYNYAGNETSRWYWRSTTARPQTKIAYTFDPKGGPSETLDSVMVGVEGKDVTLTVEVYSDTSKSQPDTKEKFETHSLNQSVCTFKLENPVNLIPGKKFCVVVTVEKGGFLVDFNGNTGNAECYTENGSSWGKITLNEGQLPVVHPITHVVPEDRAQDYSEDLFQKISAFDSAFKKMAGKGMVAENFENLREAKEALDSLTEADRKALWLTDSLRVDRCQNDIDRWERLIEGLDGAIQIGKGMM